MTTSPQDRLALRHMLQSKLNGKAAGFRDAHLDAMLAHGLDNEAKLSSAGWSKLHDQASLPPALVEALLQAYNARALTGPDTPEKQPLAPYLSSGSKNMSNCFHLADLMLVASQTADGQEGKRYRGVSACWSTSSRKWRARIHWLGRAIHLGYFCSEEAAACMYDRAAICTRGSGAMLNFPRDQYDDDDLPNGWVASEKQFAVCLKQIQEECRLLVFQSDGCTAAGKRTDSVDMPARVG